LAGGKRGASSAFAEVEGLFGSSEENYHL